MIEITEADLSQLPLVQDIAHRTWPSTFGHILSGEQIAYMLDWMYSLPALERQAQEKGHVFLLARDTDTGQWVGYASYELGYRAQPRTKLHKIYLLPNQQGKGVGRALLEHVEKAARAHGDRYLALNVNRHNRAVQFYERVGFRQVGQEVIDIGQGFVMDDYVMEKALE